METIKPIILLSQQQIDAITQDNLYGPEETILFAAKVRKLHLNGGEDVRILVISIGCIYLLRARFTKSTKVVEYNLVDLQKVSYIKPNIVSFVSLAWKELKPLTLTVKSEYALNIAKIILILNKICKYRLDLDVYNVKIESTPPNELTAPELKSRPLNALKTRILQMAHKFGYRFPLEQLGLLAEWDLNPTPALKMTSAFNLGLASKAFANALAWDVSLKSLILDNFANSQLQTVLQTIFMTSKTLTRLSIENYKEPPNSEFKFPSQEQSKLTEISFRACHVSVIFAILNGLQTYQGRFKTFTISRTKLNNEHFKALFEQLNKLPCFMSLNNLRIEEGTADGLNVDDLGEFLQQSRLKGITISRTSHDVSSLLNHILPYSIFLRSIYLINNRLFDEINLGMALPHSLVYLDMTKCQVAPASLNFFLSELFTTPRSQLLTLNVSDLATSATCSDIVNCFNIQHAQPILAEFIFSGNEMLPDDVTTLISFLKTQTRLSYLNLSRCLKSEIDESLDQIAEYINESKLSGFEYVCTTNNPLGKQGVRFIEKLIGKTSLHTLVFKYSGMSDAGLEALRNLVELNTQMTSISCDGINPQNEGFFCDAYNVFARLDRVEIPARDLSLLQSKRKGSLPKEIYSKPPPKTLMMRVAEYETFDNSSSMLVHPMDSLMEMMTKMSDSILKKKEDKKKLFNNDEVNLIDIFKKSLITTSVPLTQKEGVAENGVVGGFDAQSSELLLKMFDLNGNENENNQNKNQNENESINEADEPGSTDDS